MDIALAVDGRYFFYACVTIESVLDHHPGTRPTFWLVVTEDVDHDSRDLLKARVGRRGEVRFVDVGAAPDHGVSAHPSVTYVSEAMYLRLRIPDLVPRSVRRVLYLDADVLCTGPGLADLFGVDLGGAVIGAARDATTRRLIDNGGLPALERYPHMHPQAPYFNSGVLLIDTAAWRRERIREKCEEYLAETSGARRFPDQDALNVACYGRWSRLDKRWNHLRSHRLDTHLGNQLSEAVLIHVNSTVKPWQAEFPQGHRKDLYERLAARVRGGGRRGVGQ